LYGAVDEGDVVVKVAAVKRETVAQAALLEDRNASAKPP
jgi:hypothetical protein